MDSLKLIEMIKSYPELYDRKHKNYTNMDVKKIAWSAIAQEFNESEDSVRVRWRNIRDAYQKSIKRKHELGEIGKLSLYKKYKYEDLLEFLHPFCSTQKRRRLAGVDSKSSESPVKITKVFLKAENDDIIGEVYTEEDEFDEIERLEEMQEEHQIIEHNNSNYEDSSNYKIIETVGSDENDEDDHEIQFETQETIIPSNSESSQIDIKPRLNHQSQDFYVSEEIKPRDITINFFLNMAQTVVTFPPMLQAEVKRQIFEYVSNAEMNYLSQSSAPINHHGNTEPTD